MNESEELRDLHKDAKAGSLPAGKTLISRCRRGMLRPGWEKDHKVNREIVEKHVQRRERVMAGK